MGLLIRIVWVSVGVMLLTGGLYAIHPGLAYAAVGGLMVYTGLTDGSWIDGGEG